MKTGDFTPKPGDLFRWHDDIGDIPAASLAVMWSSTMKLYVPLCSENILLLISITDDIISWLDGDKFYHGHVADTHRSRPQVKGFKVHLRKYM